MLSEIIHIMEYTLYIYLSVSVGYIVLFSAASHFFKQKKYPATTVRQRFIIPPIKRMRSFTPASLPFCAKLIRQSFTT